MLPLLIAGAIQAEKIDPKAMALLIKVEEHLRNVKTLSADCLYIRHYKRPADKVFTTLRQRIHVKLMRPNFARIDEDIAFRRGDDAQWQPTQPFSVIASDGKRGWMFHPTDKEYQTWPSNANGTDIRVTDIQPLESFFDAESVTTNRLKVLRRLKLLHSVTLVKPRTIRLVYDHAGTTEVITEDHAIGPDLLDHRATMTGPDHLLVWELSNVKTNEPMPPAAFAYAPPKGSHEGDKYAKIEPSPGIPIGSEAPDFTAEDREGKPVKLSDYKGKVVVLDFWATWCGPCLQSFPKVSAIAKKYKDRNVVVLAVCSTDTRESFRDWTAKHTNYDAIAFAFDKAGIKGRGLNDRLYKSTSLPTVYVIDGAGKVAAYFLGYDGSEDKLEKAVATLSTSSR